jgi:hypothetical protein
VFHARASIALYLSIDLSNDFLPLYIVSFVSLCLLNVIKLFCNITYVVSEYSREWGSDEHIHSSLIFAFGYVSAKMEHIILAYKKWFIRVYRFKKFDNLIE